MIWQTITVPRNQYADALADLRRRGATITHCAPRHGLVVVTYRLRVVDARLFSAAVRPSTPPGNRAA